jgi:hypothetical protein
MHGAPLLTCVWGWTTPQHDVGPRHHIEASQFLLHLVSAERIRRQSRSRQQSFCSRLVMIGVEKVQSCFAGNCPDDVGRPKADARADPQESSQQHHKSPTTTSCISVFTVALVSWNVKRRVRRRCGLLHEYELLLMSLYLELWSPLRRAKHIMVSFAQTEAP